VGEGSKSKGGIREVVLGQGGMEGVKYMSQEGQEGQGKSIGAKEWGVG
jgi:hypothetical protein